MVHLGVNSSDVLEVFIELDLRLINPPCEGIFLIFQVFEKFAVTLICSVGLCRRLLRNVAPPGMLFNFFPVNPIDRVLFKHHLNNVVEFVREAADCWHLLDHDLLDEILKITRIKWWLPCRKLNHDTSERPKVGLVAIDAVILEELGCHVVG